VTLVAVTTRSKLRGLRFFPAMYVATVRARRQLARTRGIVSWASVIGSPTEFWTLTVWTGVHELQEFMRSGAHGEVMWRMPRWLRSFWLARWRPATRTVAAAGGPDEGAEFVLRAIEAGALTYEQSALVRRSRARLAGLGGIVVRIAGSPVSLPAALLELHRLRRALAEDPAVIRVVVGAARFRDAYLFALSSDGASLRAVLDGEWARRARERWGDRLWALEWVPENEFGHWDGMRMRSFRRMRPGREAAVDPRALFVENLAEMLTIEQTLAEEALPQLREQVAEKHFREALDEHIEQTRGHVANVERVFEQIGEKPRRATSYALDGLLRQHEEGIGEIEQSALRDLFAASSAAHTEHLEISAYHSLITLANILGEPEVVRLLERNLHDEEDALEKVEKSIPERLTGQLAPA
jgi:ferritin-like metal-binding protein YciE